MLRVAFNSNPFRKESSYSLSLSLCLPVIIFSHRNMLKAREIEEGICACVYFIFISYLFYPSQFKAPFRSLGWLELLCWSVYFFFYFFPFFIIASSGVLSPATLNCTREEKWELQLMSRCISRLKPPSALPSLFSLSFPINPFPPDPFHFGGLQSRLQLQLVLSPTFLPSSTPLLSFFAYPTKMQKCNKMHHHCRE